MPPTPEQARRELARRELARRAAADEARPSAPPAESLNLLPDVAEQLIPTRLRGVLPPFRLKEAPRIGAEAINTALGGVPKMFFRRQIESLPPVESPSGRLVQTGAQLAALLGGGPGRAGLAATRGLLKVPALASRLLGRVAAQTAGGAVAGGLSDLSEPAQIPGRAVAGGVTAGAFGGVFEGGRKALSLIRGRPAAPLAKRLTLPDPELQRLPPEQVKPVLRVQEARARLQEREATAALRAESTATQQTLKTQRQTLNTALRATSDEAVLAARPQAQAYLKNTSDEYERRLFEGIKDNATLANFDKPTLKRALLKEFATDAQTWDPDTIDLAEEVLGLQRLGQTEGNVAAQLVPWRQILQSADELGQRVNRLPGHVRDKGEQVAEKLRQFLIRQLEAQGLKVSDAKAFWAQESPFRRAVIQKLRPFEGELESSVGASFLRKAMVDPGTRRTIEQLEGKLGVRLTDEVLQISEQLRGNQEASEQLASVLATRIRALTRLQQVAREQRLGREDAILLASQHRAKLRRLLLQAAAIAGGTVGIGTGIRSATQLLRGGER